MIKCPNKNLSEWKELEETVPNMAYVIWNENNGYGIDKAPNGEPSILFQDLLKQFDGDRIKAIKEKAKIYTEQFKKHYGILSDNTILPGSIIFGHPGIGKTYALENKLDKGRFIDWDVEYNQKRDKWIEEHSNTKKGTQEFKKAKNEYLTYPEKYPDYITFITTEWNRVKNKVKQSNKILLASSHTLLKLFPQDFNRIINLHNEDFVSRNMDRGGEKEDSKLWKESIDKTINSISNIPIDYLEEGQYVSDWLDKHPLSSIYDQNGEPYVTSIVSNLQNIAVETIENFKNEELRDLSKYYDNLLKGLKSRLSSIMRYKNKNQNTLDELKSLLEKIGKMEAEQGILDFVDHVGETLTQSISFLGGNIEDINSRQLVQLKRDYLGFYTPMIKDLQALLDTTDVLNELPNKEEIKAQIDDQIALINRVNNKYDNILKLKTRQFLREYAIASGSPFVDEILQWIEDPKTDISWVAQYVGMASNTDNEVVRIMENVIRNAKNEVSRNTLSVGKDLLSYLKPAKEKYGNDVMQLLQERGNDGKTTGYFVRPLNYGQFFKDKEQYLNKLGEKYNLQKNEYDQWVLPADDKELKKYKKELEKWMSQHANRRYTPEYYELKSKLSPELSGQLDEIQKAVNSITSKVTIDNVIYDHLLTSQQRRELERLAKEKQNLANPYNLDGSIKTGEQAKLAEELRNYREVLKEKVKYKEDQAKFDKVDKHMRSILSNQDYVEWHRLNTKWEYTNEFWEDLANIYKVNVEQSEEYKELLDKRKNILKIYRKSGSLEVNLDIISNDDKAMLKQLDQDIADLYTYPEGKIEVPAGEQVFGDIATVETTADYKNDYANAQAQGPLVFQKWFEESHYEDKKGNLKPISIYTVLRPKDSKYLKLVPSNYWSTVDETSEWVNADFQQDGPNIQPKKEYYDNSKQWNEIQSKPEVKALYDKLIDTMDISNKKISFLAQSDNYKLPQMTARALQMISRQDNVFKGLKYAAKDALAIKDDDVDFVEEYALRPDNTPIKHIPTRFIKMLDDPSMITSDVVGSVIEYFSMADNFNEMSKVSDDLEMILSRLSQLEIKGKKGKTPGSLNVFLKAQQLLDMNLYGKRKNRAEISIGNYKIDATKALGNIYGYIGKVNLGYNMWAMGTNYITGQGYTDMEAILGRYYDVSDIQFAKQELFRELPGVVSNIGNVNDDSKVMSIMQYNQVTRSNEETFNRLDNSAALRAINQHFWYNGYTAGDFIVKSQVLLSVYHSYRLATDRNGNKKFMNKQEFIKNNYPEDPKKGAVAFKQLKTTLYDAYIKDEETNKWKIDPKYKKYIDTKFENLVKNKINTLASKIDGNLSDTDRSAIHANTYAQFLVMHRNFMIVGLQDRFKHRQYNYNTGEVEEGMYRTVGRFIQSEFSQGKLFALRQLLQDYSQLEDYEKYNIRKVALEMLNMIMLSLAVSMILVPLADSTDKDDKDWFLQAATYIAMRSAFEFRTLYNPFELTALLNSPSAAFASINNAADMLKLLWIPNYFTDKGPFQIIDRGVYKGMPKILRHIVKITPAKNIIEAKDPKPKRKYLENQLMF